jgi:hypothetical protein
MPSHITCSVPSSRISLPGRTSSAQTRVLSVSSYTTPATIMSSGLTATSVYSGLTTGAGRCKLSTMLLWKVGWSKTGRFAVMCEARRAYEAPLCRGLTHLIKNRP